MGLMLGHYIPRNYEPVEKEFIVPVPDDYFIYWLFKYKCVQCKRPATEINEIIPRARSKKSILDWRNRVSLCRRCHDEFHHDGVTDAKIQSLKIARNEFLISMGRMEYV